MEYNVYLVTVDLKGKVSIYVKSTSSEEAINLAKDKIEELLVRDFAEAYALEMDNAEYSKLTIYE